jgi:hypothetical protein
VNARPKPGKEAIQPPPIGCDRFFFGFARLPRRDNGMAHPPSRRVKWPWDRVLSLLPAVKERVEHLRRLPEETFEDFQEAGLFRCIPLATRVSARQA